MNMKSDPVETIECPVCGPSKTRVWLNDGKPTLYMQCRACKTVYASPRATWSSRYAWLDTPSGLGQTVLKSAKTRYSNLKQEADLIKSFVTEGRMLDIGCHVGIFYEFFSGMQWQCQGVEISPAAARYAEKTYHVKVHSGTVHEARFSDAHFDLITMLDMIYFVDDPRAQIHEVARIIKPGGILAIEMPGQQYFFRRSRGILCLLLDRKWRRMDTDSAYLYFFKPDGIHKLLADNGFTIFAARGISAPMNNNPLITTLSAAYVFLINTASHFSQRLLTWSPKVLFLARRNP